MSDKNKIGAPVGPDLVYWGGPKRHQSLDLIPTCGAATYVQLSAGHLARLRAFGEGPAYYKRGRIVLYDMSDLQEWLYGRRLDATRAFV